MKRALYIGAIGMAALELVITPTMDEPFVSAFFAVMFVVALLWYRARATMPPLVWLAVLFLVELVFLPGYDRTGVFDWLAQGATAVLSLVGLTGVVGAALQRRRTRIGAV